jgi:rubrerythrin
MSIKNFSSVKVILSRALQAEIETSNFYEKMVNEMTDEGQKMFSRFLEIEENHIAAVQAELDYITHTGYWFDFKEFDMEEL